MAILLLVLKIIGLIILSLLCFVLFVLILLLFVPVHYALEASYPNSPYGMVKASWLLKLIRFRLEYNGQSIGGKIYILWFAITTGNKSESKKNRNSRSKKRSSKAKETDQSRDYENNASKKDGIVKRVSSSKGKRKSEKELSSEDAEASKKENAVQEEKKSGFFARLFDAYSKVDDEDTKEAIRYLLEEANMLLARLGPKRMKGYLNYSLGSPDYTGYSLAFFSVLPFFYDKAFSLNADFASDDIYLDTKVKTSGRIQLLPIVVVGIRIWRNRDVKKLIRKIRKTQ